MDVDLRPARCDDLEHVKWALYTAFAWKPERLQYPFELIVEHEEAVRYHRDWGRPGDFGVVATRSDRVVGVTFCRLFTANDHGHGYIDADTPELVVAVTEGERGCGIGARLLEELASVSRAAGVVRLSLSVDAENPALRLYERLRYQELSRDEGGVRMILELG